MEKRIGAILILIKDKEYVQKLNEILSNHASIIIGRQGIPIRDKGLSIISLVIEGSTDEFSTLTGQLGRLKGVTARSILAKDGV
ncbi:MAG: putative iron-only hydrogenase system regulator [Bacteroidetes bacterium]|jgi:putative iron-only hydrogenase system regulator|nr:putative iron-only hydrogenase system regulator [Bacteroidota bacterium]